MRRSGLLVPDAPDDAQQTLPLAASVRVATNVRLFRGVLVMDSKGLAEAYVARCGNLYRVPSGRTMVQVRPRQSVAGWVLCAFSSGVPYVLCTNGDLRQMRTRDLWPGGKVL